MGAGKILRRTFLFGAAAAAGGAVFGYYYVSKPYPNPLLGDLKKGEQSFNPFIKIDPSNTITIITPRAEMGQGVHTSLASLVAEELEVELSDINVEHGPAGWVYYNEAALVEGGPFAFFDEGFAASTTHKVMKPLAKVLAIQMTGGSSSMRDYYTKMRQAGANAKGLLLQAAAKRWNVDVDTLKALNASVINPETGENLSYGELAGEAVSLSNRDDVPLKPRSEWKVLGHAPARVDVPAKVNGSAEFGIDVELPDMVHATVKMSPRFGAKARSMDDSQALAISGVKAVVPIDLVSGSGYGIIADHTWAAFKGAEALKVEWEEADYPKFNRVLMDKIRFQKKSGDSFSLRDDGDVELQFADAPRTEVLASEYSVPFLAHATMEPLNATARLTEGKLEIWAPNQAPTLIQMVCSEQVGLEPDQVFVTTTYLGGGFGRKAEIDFIAYAVEIAKHTDGKPVKVTWSREEDMTHDTYRPAAIASMRARIAEKDVPRALDIHIGGPSVVASFMGRTFPSISPMGPDRTLIEGCFDQPLKLDHYRVRGTPVDLGIPVGFWRSVGNSFNGFFHECFLDEIAYASKMDPIELRRKAMADYPAALGVVEKVAQMSDWDAEREPLTGKGFAHTLSFGAWVAQVIKVRMVDDAVKIEDVWCAVEIGTAINPEIIKDQVMSGIVFGLSSALGQQITFEKGEVLETNYDSYECMRMNQAPKIHVEVLETYHKMGGAGEVGTPPSIPALANAIFDATRLRIRQMPLSEGIDFI